MYLFSQCFVLADGLALGAAAGLSKTNVELIIFIAIMLHKVSQAICNVQLAGYIVGDCLIPHTVTDAILKHCPLLVVVLCTLDNIH